MNSKEVTETVIQIDNLEKLDETEIDDGSSAEQDSIVSDLVPATNNVTKTTKQRLRPLRKRSLPLILCSKNYKCTICGHKFSRSSQLKAHIKTHEATPEHECSTCKEAFEDVKALANHKKECHSGNFHCSLCNTYLSHQTSYKIHMRLHTGTRPYVCKECGASFAQSGHLSIHKRTHTGEKPYTCEICSMQFKQISHLKTHVRTHTHDKPYKCTQCTAAFTQNSSLKRHRRSHTGEKPFQCLHCPMTFVVKSNMQRHLNTHTGERPFQCDLCPTSFGQAIDLKRHKISHTGIKPFKCDLCDSAFSRKNNLKWHRLTHSENAGYQCSVCFVGFSTTGDLKAHMRNHAPPKQFLCDVCPSSFRVLESLNRHKMIHTGERPLRRPPRSSTEPKSKRHMCPSCEASFCEKRNLKRHMIAVHRFEKDLIEVGELKLEPEPVRLEEETVSTMETLPAEIHLQGTSQICIQPLASAPVQQIVMQNGCSNDPVAQVVRQFTTGSSRTARPAGNCQNHSAHILTFNEGTTNQWQSWCFCEPQNLPTPQVIIPAITSDTLTQVVLTTALDQPLPDSATQLFMNVAQPIGESHSQLIINPSPNIVTQNAITIDGTAITS